MRAEPQAIAYQPDPVILPLASWLADPVMPADFPKTILRYRNDRWAEAVGLNGLSDEQWVAHMARFTPLPGNLPEPLALRYHGHQFRHYNPEIGDGRGFLFAQMRDGAGRLLDLGTKGSGRTPWSRDGDGRLTLKGAVREILATEMLEALGVNTSKTFSVVETGESLWRGDEPSPTRSAVLVRLSHGHIRIGTFQRLLMLDERENMETLVNYCLDHFPGPDAPSGAPAGDEPAVRLMHQVVERMADLAASWMVAGFVHGVLNTDNMNISGESFDYGPWRWLLRWDPAFTAAYFDHSGLYAFGRQPEALLWNCSQLAVSLRLLAESKPLIFALDRFGACYEQAMARQFCWRLGIEEMPLEDARALIASAEREMREKDLSPDAFFFRHRGGRNAMTGEFGERLTAATAREDALYHPMWSGTDAPTMHIDEVERIWSAIADKDDWQELANKISTVRELGAALNRTEY